MKWILIYLSLLGIIISLWIYGWHFPQETQTVLHPGFEKPALASSGTAGCLAIIGLAGILVRHFERKRTPRKKLHGEID